MTLSEIYNILKIDKNISDRKINKICTDSRNIEKNDLFIALKGKKYNGNDYAKIALEKGAIMAIVDEDIKCDMCFKVKNTYDVLFKIGNYIRKKYDVPLIAITGSNGKTTTKELIAFILKRKFNVLYNMQSKNNIIGVSDTLFKLNKKNDLIIMELGSNHMGEIKTLSMMCEPNISVITNIGSSHLKYFKNKKNIFKEKTSIIDGMSNGKLFVNGDDEYLSKLNAFKCGVNEENDLIAYDIKEQRNSVLFKIKLDKEYNIVFNNPGKHFIIDILLAIKVCLEFMDITTIIDRIKKYKLIDKRMNIIKNKYNTIINDCYNSSLESFSAGLNYLNQLKGDKVIIFGDILELGKYSKKIHKRIGKMIDKKIKVLTVGKYSKYISGIHFDSISQMIEYLNQNKIVDSNIYIKGSRRMELDRIVDFFLNKV